MSHYHIHTQGDRAMNCRLEEYAQRLSPQSFGEGLPAVRPGIGFVDDAAVLLKLRPNAHADDGDAGAAHHCPPDNKFKTGSRSVVNDDDEWRVCTGGTRASDAR